MIPEIFYKCSESSHHPRVKTVDELREILLELPGNLRIECGFNEGCELIVYNYGSDDPYLEFVEIEEDDHEEDC